MITAVDVIRTKRDGGELSTAQIDWVIDAYTKGAVADEQMSALAMAIFLNGAKPREIADWTAAMIRSGITLDLAAVGKPCVDKHSTGGVGDKITLPLAPLVAVFDVAVPQLSGRGLGHTGGTLDKLESIPGFRVDLTEDRVVEQLKEIGAVICAATGDLAPADKKLYALRDITSTVESIPLIASSIMCKKIAEGADAIVLDVKVGSGAFMKDFAQARELAETMVRLGGDHDVDTRALLTDMSVPLGRTAGNALEVRESVEVLAGGGPEDVVELTVALAKEMLAAAGRPDADPAAALNDGRAMDKWRRMVAAQGGDADAPLPVARESEAITADADGFVAAMDAYAVGVAAWRLGAGRERQGQPVQAGAGIEILKAVGEPVKAGEPVFRLHTDAPERFAAAKETLAGQWSIAAEPAKRGPLILDRIV
ncbi:thymidine phosphorylase [Glycomyces sp. TRM65418]|uniref:thymidine phosphorylase n=1 Tax=Glycomyces sp. TRM65418 TaxID=2867006 RepID=UPI001CE6DEE9|nr:thymidine phosphorylase [Glycomyces sp. TRM65418]MCC3763602.1 thymidine phosphorylase [Glycomyces sp. TRM65418]QZD57585.1 thymidine phosphorylase [Glycomyces sp. TRM65418]